MLRRSGGAHIVLHEVVDSVDLGGQAGRAQVDRAGAGQAPERVEHAHNVAALVAHQRARPRVHQQRRGAAAAVPRAARVVDLPAREKTLTVIRHRLLGRPR